MKLQVITFDGEGADWPTAYEQAQDCANEFLAQHCKTHDLSSIRSVTAQSFVTDYRFYHIITIVYEGL